MWGEKKRRDIDVVVGPCEDFLGGGGRMGDGECLDGVGGGRSGQVGDLVGCAEN